MSPHRWPGPRLPRKDTQIAHDWRFLGEDDWPSRDAVTWWLAIFALLCAAAVLVFAR